MPSEEGRPLCVRLEWEPTPGNESGRYRCVEWEPRPPVPIPRPDPPDPSNHSERRFDVPMPWERMEHVRVDWGPPELPPDRVRPDRVRPDREWEPATFRHPDFRPDISDRDRFRIHERVAPLRDRATDDAADAAREAGARAARRAYEDARAGNLSEQACRNAARDALRRTVADVHVQAASDLDPVLAAAARDALSHSQGARLRVVGAAAPALVPFIGTFVSLALARSLNPWSTRYGAGTAISTIGAIQFAGGVVVPFVGLATAVVANASVASVMSMVNYLFGVMVVLAVSGILNLGAGSWLRRTSERSAPSDGGVHAPTSAPSPRPNRPARASRVPDDRWAPTLDPAKTTVTASGDTRANAAKATVEYLQSKGTVYGQNLNAAGNQRTLGWFRDTSQADCVKFILWSLYLAQRGTYPETDVTDPWDLVVPPFEEILHTSSSGRIRQEIAALVGAGRTAPIRKGSPKPGDILVWGTHFGIAVSVGRDELTFAHSSGKPGAVGSGPKLTRARMDKVGSVWGSGGWVGYWTPPE